MAAAAGTATSTDALLEDFLITVDYVPACMRRNLNLIAVLDATSNKLQRELEALVGARMKEIETIISKARKNTHLTKAIKNDDAEEKIQSIRDELRGLAEEKISVAKQLLEIIAGHHAALNLSIQSAESMMQAKADGAVMPGAQVSHKAVNDDGEIQWELGTLDHRDPNSNKWVIVDAEDPTRTTQTSDENFIVLPDIHLNVKALPIYRKDQRVMAVYPGTTVFYPGKIVTPPVRKANGKITSAVIIFDADFEDADQTIPKKTGDISAHTMFPEEYTAMGNSAKLIDI